MSLALCSERFRRRAGRETFGWYRRNHCLEFIRISLLRVLPKEIYSPADTY